MNIPKLHMRLNEIRSQTGGPLAKEVFKSQPHVSSPDHSTVGVAPEKGSSAAPAVGKTREQSMAMTTPSQENNTLNLGNITTLNYKAAFDQYNFVDSLVESGQFDAANFRGFNGAEQAETAEQYLFWLQARMQEIDQESG
ncbi:hypothetical protein BKI51_10375 [Alphaproteobacteria bacterium AO1-B]|nr:hypothetical protein BKI51_10375 [Alphaproteobacteria bacterium AO1-B]